MPDNAEQGVNRRQFFKSAFVELTKVVLEFSGAKGEASPKRRNYLRPPGAVEEGLFNTLCTRCDECIKVCPHQCIRGSDSESATGARVGTPIIRPQEAACRLCHDFPCITACKDGALRPVGDIRKVKIGVALIDRRRCLDYTFDYMGAQTSPCQQCYSQCPLKDEAITLEGSGPVVQAEKCVGCGICENVCQTVNPPSSVRVFPMTKVF